jgi:hypothetical protein
MKKLGTVLAVLMSVALVAGCGKSPKDTAKAFTENLSKGKISESKKYATEQTGQLLDMASSMGVIPVEPNFRFILVEQVIDGNKAVVKYRETPDGEVESMDLVKIDGKWKVHMKKDE